MVAAAIVGSAVVGGVASSMSASKAAGAQSDAANASNATQRAMYDQTRKDLLPYSQAGASATNALASLMGLGPGSVYGPAGAASVDYDGQINALQTQLNQAQSQLNAGSTTGAFGNMTGRRGLAGGGAATANQASLQSQIASLTSQINALQTQKQQASQAAGQQTYSSPLDSPLLKPFDMSQAALEQTPGYQFNLTQGLKAVQNSAAARGLGVSGAALKGASTYATGLADSTYQNQFNNYVTNQTNQYNRLMGLANQGENAAAQTGAYGTQTAANIGNNLTGAANAQGAAYLQAGNAIANGANNVGSYYALKGIYG